MSRSRLPSVRRSAAVAVGVSGLLLATAVQVSQVAQAADPSQGTVKPSAPTANWDGQNYPLAATVDPEACPPKEEDPTDALCDHYTLNVPVDRSFWADRDGGVSVTITWPEPDDDFDLYIYKGGDMVASSASGGTTKETAVLSKPSGTYEVRVLPFLVTASGYQGTAEFTSGPSTGEPPPGGPAEFHGTSFEDTKCPAASCRACPTGNRATSASTAPSTGWPSSRDPSAVTPPSPPSASMPRGGRSTLPPPSTVPAGWPTPGSAARPTKAPPGRTSTSCRMVTGPAGHPRPVRLRRGELRPGLQPRSVRRQLLPAVLGRRREDVRDQPGGVGGLRQRPPDAVGWPAVQAGKGPRPGDARPELP